MAYSRADKARQLAAVLDEVSRSVDGLAPPVLRKILPVLEASHAEVEKELRFWLRREVGSTLYTTQRYRNSLVAIRHALARTRRRLGITVKDALWDSTERIGRMATSHLQEELVRFARIFEGTIQPIALEEAAIIARGDELLWPRFENSATRYAGGIGDGLMRELAIARVRGLNISELTSRLEKRLPHLWQGNRVDTMRLVRTETLNAYNAYHLEGLRAINADDPEIIARWDGSFDFRRCPMCASLDGQAKNVAKGEKFEARWFSTRKKKMGTKQFHMAVERPPAHPNCRCVLTPWRADWAEYARPGTPKDKAEKARTEAQPPRPAAKAR